MSSIADKLEKVLSDMRAVGGIDSCVIASRDGLLMASSTPSFDSKAELFAAMSATMLGAAETATTELGKGVPRRVIVESEHGKLIAVGAGPKALLIVLTRPDAALGLVLVEMEKAADMIKEIL